MNYLQKHPIKAFFTSIIVVAFTFLLSQLGYAQSQAKTSDTRFEQATTGPVLTIVIDPPGAGSVSKSPDKASYDPGELVQIQANASGSYSFLHWDGNVDRYTRNPLNIYMEEDRTIRANFVITNSSKISTPTRPTGPTSANTGQWLDFNSGGATSSIGGDVEYIYDWGDGRISVWGSASRTYAYGKAGTYNVRVRARSTADPYTVSNWSSTLTISVSGPDKYILTITVEPEGAGRVEIDPEKEGYDDGDIVNLQAIPYSGYSFSYWSGGLKSSSNPVNIYMLKSRSIIANFTGGGGGGDTEVVSRPSTPTGPTSGDVNQVLSFSTGGAASSLGHEVEYQFDWGDGIQSTWSLSTRSHTYTSSGTFLVKARARCKTHTDIVSSWSSSMEVTIGGGGGSTNTYTLTINVSPDGGGTVNINPEKASYNEGEAVQLTAVPSADYTFDSWSGDLTSTLNPVTIYMLKNRTITANFVGGGGGGGDGETVSVPDTPTGPSSATQGQNLSFTTGGSVNSLGHSVEYQFDWGDGNQSTWGITTRSHSYSSAGTYQVRARARCATHTSVVSGWSGSKSVSVSGSNETYTLTVLVDPDGAGVVLKNPDKETYNQDEMVELTAVPYGNYEFDHWSGDINPYTTNPIKIYMRKDRTIIANFTGELGEDVSAPNKPDGPITGFIGDTLSFATGGSVSSLGHTVEYQFDWGDGNQSDWGDSTGLHAYDTEGTYFVKAWARCTVDTVAVSDWSDSLEVVILGDTTTYKLTVQVDPEQAGRVQVKPAKSEYRPDEIVLLYAVNYNGNGIFDQNIYIEAETGLISGNFEVGNDTSASGGLYIHSTVGEPGDGSAMYTFDIEEAGNYTVWGRCYASSNTGDSFFFLVDGGQDTITWHLDADYNVWKWQQVSHNSEGKEFTFDVGQHTITVIKRELEARLDKLIITKDNAFQPEGKQEFPNSGLVYTFDHWSGDLSGTFNPAELVMDSDKSVTAHFIVEGEEQITPPVTPVGPDTGYVGQSLSFITGGAVSNFSHQVEYQFDWGDSTLSAWGDSIAEHAYNEIAAVYVKARARCKTDTTVVSEWSPIHTVIIIEQPILTYTLTLLVEPPNKGTVTAFPVKPEYMPGDTVVLSATPIAGYTFDHWSGDLSGNDNPVTIIMLSNKTIKAHFSQIVEHVSTPTKPAGPDSGMIGQSLTFSTGGSNCNLGHPVEYQFDWGDGTLSDWGQSTRHHTYSVSDTFKIRARTRCKVNTTVISDWSEEFVVYIATTFSYTLTITVDPPGSGSVNRTPYKETYESGETVILSPLAAPGYLFDHWSGDLTGDINPAYILIDGNKTIIAHFTVGTGIAAYRDATPEEFALNQNYPNPFNPETSIQYQLPENCDVKISIFNMQGQVVKVLVNEFQSAGFYSVIWRATDDAGNKLPSGVYFYLIEANNFSQVNKMILMK